MSLPKDDLSQALAQNIPGREGDWAGNLCVVLGNVERALRRHAAAAEAPDGLYADVDLTRPTLARRVAELRRQHAGFLDQVRSLRRELEAVRQAWRPYERLTGADTLPDLPAVGAVPDLGALRQRVEDFWVALREHTRAEADLVVETVTTDIGVGD
jgi:hypothetical protein